MTVSLSYRAVVRFLTRLDTVQRFAVVLHPAMIDVVECTALDVVATTLRSTP